LTIFQARNKAPFSVVIMYSYVCHTPLKKKVVSNQRNYMNDSHKPVFFI